MTIDVKSRSLYVNRKKIAAFSNMADLISVQFMLHHTLNLEYSNKNYYLLLEIFLGLHKTVPRNISKALKGFLAVYS